MPNAAGPGARAPTAASARAALLAAVAASVTWLGRFCPACAGGPLSSRLRARWAAQPRRRERLREAQANGLFHLQDRMSQGATLGEEEVFWSGEYAPDGTFKFWSLGRPKVETERLMQSLRASKEGDAGEGLSAVLLGCGLGLDVDFIARQMAAKKAPVAVAGIDFAWPAIEEAREKYGETVGVSFHHGDVCDLPAPDVPLDILIDNTVFQNVYRSGRLESYLSALRRISTPGHTVLQLNLMSQEGVESRPEFTEGMEYLNLPLLRKQEICEALGGDWQIWECREGHYDLKPEEAGFSCEAFYTYGAAPTPGIPSWCVLAAKL